MYSNYQFSSSEGFVPWLAEQQASLAFTTYQADKLFLIGMQEENRLSIFERSFPRCMGLWADAQNLWMSSLYQLWRFENVLAPGQTHEDHDRLYVPLTGHTTGNIDIHDIAVEEGGRVLFASTLFSCLGTVSETHSFDPVWKPPFISRLAAEDRCHLNGLALRDGAAGFVTAAGNHDVSQGWRDQRLDGGLVLDVASGETVAAGLSMPHSPRLRDGRLWLHQSGTGQFGYLDNGAFEETAFCPGYLRGLGFSGEFAVVGLSRPRGGSHAFHELPIQDRLGETEAWCGLGIIDLNSGALAHWLRIDGLMELYDVAVIPGVIRPMALGFRTNEIRTIIRVGELKA